MAELVDALDSKSSSGNRVRVRFPPSVLCSFGSIFFIPNEALKSVGGLIFLPNNPPALCELRRKNAEVVKLVDTHVSGACAFTSVGVRVPPSAHLISQGFMSFREFMNPFLFWIGVQIVSKWIIFSRSIKAQSVGALS